MSYDEKYNRANYPKGYPGNSSGKSTGLQSNGGPEMTTEGRGVKLSTKTYDFDKAIRSITQERGVDYGHPKDDFTIAQAIKEAVASCPNVAVRHAMEMIGVKMARLCTSPDHVDTIIDIAGYARTMVMILDRDEKDE
jgi:hypothetical protein